MSRMINMIAEAIATADHCDYAVLVKLDFLSGSQCVFNGLGKILFNGFVYSGIGTLGAIGVIGESPELRPLNNLEMTLSGVPEDLVGPSLNRAEFFNRAARVDIAFFDERLQLVQPVEPAVWVGTMDRTNFHVGEGGESIVTLNCTDALALWNQSIGLMWTHEHQQLLWPGDNLLKHVTQIMNKPLYWGGQQLGDHPDSGTGGGRSPGNRRTP